jgi:hypothetical protein
MDFSQGRKAELMLTEKRARGSREPAPYAAEDPFREIPDPLEYVQLAQVVEYRIEDRDRQQREKQTQRLAADDENAYRAVSPGAGSRGTVSGSSVSRLSHFGCV